MAPNANADIVTVEEELSENKITTVEKGLKPKKVEEECIAASRSWICLGCGIW